MSDGYKLCGGCDELRADKRVMEATIAELRERLNKEKTRAKLLFDICYDLKVGHTTIDRAWERIERFYNDAELGKEN